VSTTLHGCAASKAARQTTVDDIEATLERLDGHEDAIADSIHPQSVLNRLFD
jgi:hypothetical protein